MKSRTVILSVFALLVCASCSKVESGAGSVAGGGGETVLSAAIAKAEVSKTWVDGKVIGSSLPVYWSDGDAINVNGQASSPLSVPQGTKLSVAEFNMRSVRAPYNIIYPASIVRAEAYSAEGSIEVEIPDVQAYSPDSFATGAAVMYGYGDVEGAEVAMHSLCSVIRVTLKGTDQDAISQAGLTASGEDAFVAGTFSLCPSTGEIKALDGKTSLTLAIDTPVVLDSEGKDFWMTVPSGVYERISISFKRDSDSRKMLCIWTPASNLAAGTVYHFSDVEFVPGAKDIETPDDWEEFALACNTDGSDMSKWINKEGRICIGADITADDLTKIANLADTLVIDGQGHALTRNAATGPLFGTVSGKVLNIVTKGSYVAEDAPNRTAPVADELASGGRIEGCSNYMDIDVPLVEDHVMLSGIVRLMTGGAVNDCHNYGNITGRPDVTAADYNCQVAGIVAQVYPEAGEDILIGNCTNSGTIIQKPKSPTKHVYGIPVSGMGGIAGWIRYRAEAGGVTLDNCDNSGKIYFDGSDITDETGMKACTISVGGIAGLAANISTSGGSLVVPNGSNSVNVTFKDCDNTGLVYNCGMNYSTSSSSSNKSFAGGLVGTLTGNSGEKMASLVNCTNKGDVIPYDVTTEDVEVPSARPAYCSVAGGLVGFGGYVRMEGCTVKCRIGNGKRLVASLGGAIGFNVRPFIIKGCSVYFDGYFQRITGYKMNRSVLVTVPVKYTGGSAMALAPDVKGSEISGCRGGATLLTNANTVINGEFDKDRSDLTKKGTYTTTIFNDSSSAMGYLVCGEQFSLNPEEVTLSDNTFWMGI